MNRILGAIFLLILTLPGLAQEDFVTQVVLPAHPGTQKSKTKYAKKFSHNNKSPILT